MTKKRLYVATLAGLMVLSQPPSTSSAQVTFRTPINTGQAINNYFDNDETPEKVVRYDCQTTFPPSGDKADNHHGVDFPVIAGTPVYAAAAGRVTYRYSGCNDTGSLTSTCGAGYGNHYRIDHAGDTYDGKGLTSIYAHMSSASIAIATNTPVSCSQQLGLSAASGQVTGPHLHFEVRTNGNDSRTKTDPYGGKCSSHPLNYWRATTTASQPTTQCYNRPLAPSTVWTLNPTASSLLVGFRDNSLNETSILLERETGTSGTWSQIANFGTLSGASDWSWSNTGLSPSQMYCYRARAQNSYGYSPYSNVGCGTTSGTTSLPAAPSNVSVNNPTTSSLRINFTDNAVDETAILLERKLGTSGTYSQIASFAALSGTGNYYWDNTGLPPSTTYCYRLRAQNAAGYSAYSNEGCGTTLNSATPPLPPSNVSVTNPTTSSLRVNFTDNASDETAILLERKTGTSGTYTQIANFGVLAGTGSWYSDNTGLASGTTYCYRLRAQNAAGYSAYSNEACGTTLTVSGIPSAPSNVSVTNPTSSSLQVNFTDNATNETDIWIQRKIGTTGTWISLGSFGALTGTDNWYWTNSGILSRTTYCYRLYASNSYGSSAFSNEACGSTL